MLRFLKVSRKQLSRWLRLAKISVDNLKPNLSQQPLGVFDPEQLEILEDLKTLSVEGNKVKLELANAHAELDFYKNGMIKVFISGPAAQSPPLSTPAVVSSPPPAAIEVEQEDGRRQGASLKDQGISIKYHRYKAHVGFHPFRVSLLKGTGETLCADKKVGYTTDRMVVYKELQDEHFYGGGEQTGPLDKKGRYLEYWNTDAFSAHNDDTLHMYCSIPFVIGFPGHTRQQSGKVYGLFIDYGGCSFFDLGRKDPHTYYLGVNNQSIIYYLIPGETIKDVVEKFTRLTGRMAMPPLWSLGFHLSKWSYFPYERVYKIAQLLRKKKIPADAIHLDIDYMDGYQVFTFDRDYFPNPRRMMNKLQTMGFKTVTILDPGVKADPEYPVFKEGVDQGYFVKAQKGGFFTGEVWGKESAFPDFLQEQARVWWAGLVRDFVTEHGVGGIWNDMNEPSEFTSVFRTLPDTAVHRTRERDVPHRTVHNLYSLLENQATWQGLVAAAPQRRPFILSRSGFAGIQRYTAIWTGDNRSRFSHLAMAIPINCNLGLSGVAFVGNDVGGFNENCHPELFARWIEMGAFTPFFRVHNICNARAQEPWAFGPEIEEISRKYISLRYRLLPYIYNQFYKAHKTGIPVMAPLVMEYEDDPMVFSMDDQYLFGSDLLVAPILRAGQTERQVYIPKGWWFDFWTDQMYQGGGYIKYQAPLDTLPVFIKADAIIPSWEQIQSASACPAKEINLDLYPVTGGSLYYYEDDGETTQYKNDQYNIIEIKHSVDHGEIKIALKYAYQNYQSPRERFNVRLHGIGNKRLVRLGGATDPAFEISGIFHDEARRILGFSLPDSGRDLEVWTIEEVTSSLKK